MSTARQDAIMHVFETEFGALMQRSPEAFEKKFRKMAKNAFAFYRGTACLFYHDVASQTDPFMNEKTSRVWIHGDKHAENFGTYMNSVGRFVFNINDFDESFVGSFTWDLKRFAASIKLLGISKALSDDIITELVRSYTEGYIEEITHAAEHSSAAVGELTLDTTRGVIHSILQHTRQSTRVDMLASRTMLENNDRRFAPAANAFPVDAQLREQIEEAFDRYLDTLPESNTFSLEQRRIKDVVRRSGMGIGSAGLPSYELLLEGPTEALQDDILVYMKEAQVPAVSRHIEDPEVHAFFEHPGHRTATLQRALQAHADPWAGYTTLNGVGQVVAEVSPYAQDLEWDDVNSVEEIREVVHELGQTTARMHSVADDDPHADIVNFSTEEEIAKVVNNDAAGFTQMLAEFAHEYGDRATQDHALFVDLFRNGHLLR